MRALVVHAHPVETSFSRSLYAAVTETLAARGYTVDALSLYDEHFDAVLSREERIHYEEVPGNITPGIEIYVERLKAADAIVFVHPVWNYGYPAILKGFFDRVFLPGVSFVLEAGTVKPNLKNIRKVAFVTTYGGDRWRTMLMGDPPRRLARRWAWGTFQTRLPPKYLALYRMDKNGEPELKVFLNKVKAEFSRW
jgi:putative NADPH-quinone reductase